MGKITKPELVAFAYYVHFNGDIERADQAIADNPEIEETFFDAELAKFKRESPYPYWYCLKEKDRYIKKIYPELPKVIFAGEIAFGSGGVNPRLLLEGQYHVGVYGVRDEKIMMMIDKAATAMPDPISVGYYDPNDMSIRVDGAVITQKPFPGKKTFYNESPLAMLFSRSCDRLIIASSSCTPDEAQKVVKGYKNWKGLKQKVGIIPSSFSSKVGINNSLIASDDGFILSDYRDLLNIMDEHSIIADTIQWRNPTYDMKASWMPRLGDARHLVCLMGKQCKVLTQEDFYNNSESERMRWMSRVVAQVEKGGC